MLLQAAKALGWASIGIGLTEILAPRRIEKVMGIHNGQNTGVLRTLGVREIMHGLDILAHRNPTHAVWARVGGDLLDGALLAAAGTKTKRPSGFLAICALVLPIVIADFLLAPALSKSTIPGRGRIFESS